MATRTVRREAEKRDIEKEMLQNCLLDLLRDEDNRYCVDCDAKGPRWAAWNIGVFLCIRCAGIHRKLGVHISKVKSVNLDSWTPEQVQSMRVVGNSMARGVYEAGMPEHFRRPQSDQSLESFIRAKYEQKRYIMKDWVKPKVDVADLPIYGELQELWKHGTVRIKSSSMQKVGAPKPVPPPASANQAKAGIQAPAAPQKQEPSPTPVAVEKPKPSAMNDLLDLSMPVAATSTVPTSLFPTNSSSNAIDDLLGLDSTPNQPQTSPGGLHPVASAPSLTTGDLFGDFTSHQPTSPAAQSATSTPVQPVDSTKSKQDIMALFASGSGGPGGNPGPTVPQPNPMVVPGQGLGPNPFGQPVASGPPRPGVPGSMMFPGQQPGFPPMNMNPQPVGGFPQLQQQQQFPFGAPQAPAPNNNMAGVRAQFGQMSFGTPGAAGMNANTLANNLWQ